MTMSYQRCSPISFSDTVLHKEMRGGWEVALEYGNEESGPYLIDLSHIAKGDIQNSDLFLMKPWGLTVPSPPGGCTLEEGILLSRLNRTQAAAWHLTKETAAGLQDVAFTDTTDAHALLALVGKEAFSIMEKLSALDLTSPDLRSPFLLQGPVLHVRALIAVLGETDNMAGILIAYSRGYGQSMAEAFLDAGLEYGLRPAGERKFRDWLGGI